MLWGQAYLMYVQKGDVVQHVKSGEKRTVTDTNDGMGLISFEDSHLVGWANAEHWRPTGERIEAAK